MLAPETVQFPSLTYSEKRGQLNSVSEIVNEKGCFSCFFKDQRQPVVVEKMKIVVKNRDVNQLKLALTHDTDFYRSKNVPSLASLIFSRDFTKTFVLQGDLFLQSLAKDHLKDDFLAILPNGDLLISVDESTSQKMHLSEGGIHKPCEQRVKCDHKMMIYMFKKCIKIVQKWF